MNTNSAVNNNGPRQGQPNITNSTTSETSSIASENNISPPWLEDVNLTFNTIRSLLMINYPQWRHAINLLYQYPINIIKRL